MEQSRFSSHPNQLNKPPLPVNIDSAKIFVGGLSWQSTEVSLRKHFEQYGNVVSVEVMRDRNTGDPRGFAFVVFDSDDTVDIVMKHQHEIDNKVVDVKRAQARGFAPPSIHPMKKQMIENSLKDASTKIEDKNNKIFVGGLPLHVEKDELSKHFSQFGVVTDAVVMMDPTHTRSRGFGFVTFEMGSGAVQRALADQPHTMHGKFVEIKLAQPKENNSANHQSGASGGRRNQTTSANDSNTVSNARTSNTLIHSEFFGLASAYARNGWKAGFASRAFGQSGWAVLGWDAGDLAPERSGFSFKLLEIKDESAVEREAKRRKLSA